MFRKNQRQKISFQKGADFITKTFLVTLAVGGTLTLAMVMPGLLQALKPFIVKTCRRRYYLNNLPQKLAKQGFVAMREVNGEVEIHLTKRGREKVLRYKLDDMKLPQDKVWDGKYRIIIFDIPDKRKVARNHFRKKILELGMYHLQKSVMVYPYNCEDEIDFIKEMYEIRPFVRYMVVDYLDRESDVKRFFGLKK